MVGSHPCPMCDTGRAFYYVCKSCRAMLDSTGPGWETAPWFKAIIQSANRLARAEYREAQLIAKLNEVGPMEAPSTFYDRAVALVRSGLLDEDLLMERLSAGRGRVNKAHLRKVIARALDFCQDELSIIAATQAEGV